MDKLSQAIAAKKNSAMMGDDFQYSLGPPDSGFSLFLFLVLRRLVDIQAKLHESRADVKTIGHGVPMGMPIGSSVPPRSKFD